MNQIIRSFLNTHINEYELKTTNEISFEHFINRCIINKYVNDRFNPNDIMTDPGERGLDGVAILINSNLILSISEAQEFFTPLNKHIKPMEIRFVFIQTKTGDKFDGSDIGDLFYGIKAFFADVENRPITNTKMESLIEIKDYLYQHSIDFKESPRIDAYLVCCGSWDEKNGLDNRAKIEIDGLMNYGIFSKAEFFPYDSEKIITTYKELKKKVTKILPMEKRISFPSIDGVKQAYLGLVKCKNFVELLKDSDGNMLTNVFEDNVRDFQGYNSVNTEIKATIKDTDDQVRFSLLNNGITVVASRIEVTGDNVEVSDYQIVNGCQTSYVLYENAELINESSSIILKLIEVSDVSISDRVIFTTNRQTEVKSEAFASTKKFHKRLQDYYESNPTKIRLYYERRSKQYDLVDSIRKTDVVSLAAQIQSYVACFLGEPHSVHRYYGELLDAYSQKLFLETDSYDAYYTAALLVHLVDGFFWNNSNYSKYKKFKFYIAYGIKVLLSDSDVIFGQKRKQTKVAETILTTIIKDSDFKRSLDTIISCLNETIDKFTDRTAPLIKSRAFTEEFTKRINSYKNASNIKDYLEIGKIVDCTVSSIDLSFVNVTLKTTDSRKYGSIHISEFKNKYIRNLTEETKTGEHFQAKIIDYDDKYGWCLSCLILSNNGEQYR
jgi:predicted RNA-binding protein with RPS1 domain